MAAKKKASSKKAVRKDEVEVDFKETESRGGKKRTGGRAHYPEGDYAVKITRAEVGKSPEKGTPQVSVTFQFTDGKLKGKEITDQFYLTEKSLWRFRNLLEAAGIKVPDKAVKVKMSMLKGKKLAITLEDEEYNEKMTSRVTDTFALTELDTDTEVESDDDDEDEDEDDETEDDDDDEDEDDEEDDEEETSDDDDEEEDLESIDLDDV